MTEYVRPEKEVPLVDIALSEILEQFEAQGYGVKFTHDELTLWMGIRKATDINGVKKEQLDYMTGICKVKDALLDDYNLCLHSIQGHGYTILHPNDQVSKGADYYIKKSQKALTRYARVLVNLDATELSIESRHLQLSKTNRAAFIKAAFRKRRLPGPVKNKEIQ